MKKFIIAALFLFSLAVIVTSCGTVKRTGCPNAEGIIH
jgi:hypothetical protein